MILFTLYFLLFIAFLNTKKLICEIFSLRTADFFSFQLLSKSPSLVHTLNFFVCVCKIMLKFFMHVCSCFSQNNLLDFATIASNKDISCYLIALKLLIYLRELWFRSVNNTKKIFQLDLVFHDSYANFRKLLTNLQTFHLY